MKKIILLFSLAFTSFILHAQEFEKPKLINKSYWGFGGGLTISSLPVATSEFKMPLTTLYYDYTLSNVQGMFGGFIKPGFSVGLYGLNGFVPVPEAEIYMMVNDDEDLSLRLAAGGFYDVLIGGHSGVSLKFSVIVNREYSVDFLSVPSAKPPVKPYSELVDGGPKEIKTPYFGLMFTWRFPSH